MYFDPLSAWLVAIVADSIAASSYHVTNSQMAEYYRKNAKQTNDILNGNILALRNKGYVSAEYALRDIKIYVERAQKSYEIRQGYAKLDISREALEFIVKLCEECWKEFSNDYKTCSNIYQERLAKGDSDDSLKSIKERIALLQAKVDNYNHILEIAKKGRANAVAREEERTRKIAESDSYGATILKSILVIGLCVAGFVIAMSGNGLIGGLALVGAVIGGYFLIK